MQTLKKAVSGEIDHSENGLLDKVDLAAQVGKFLSSGGEDKQRAVVENLARVLANDISCMVREALASELRSCKELPGDVAERIATDIEQVAVPFLRETEAFTAQELARLIPNLAEYARVAVGSRPEVPCVVTEALAEFGGDLAILTLLGNVGVELSENACGIIIDRYSDDTDLMDIMAIRADLPLSVIESVIAYVSERTRLQLMDSGEVSEEMSHMLAEDAQIISVSRAIHNASLDRVIQHVRELIKSNSLEPSTILAILERGDRRFFEVSMAEMIGIPLTNVRALMRNGGDMGVERLLSCAGISESYVPLFETAVSAIPPGRGRVH